MNLKITANTTHFFAKLHMGRDIRLIALLILAFCLLPLHAQTMHAQSVPCGLATPQGCLGQPIVLTMVDGEQMQGVVYTVIFEGQRYSLSEEGVSPAPPGESIIGIQQDDGQSSVVTLAFVTQLIPVGSAAPSFTLADTGNNLWVWLFIAVILLLVLLILAAMLMPDTAEPEAPSTPQQEALPADVLTAFLNEPLPDVFFAPRVTSEHIQQSGLPVDETTYLTVGGGLGSFAWADALRISGAATDSIRVIGPSPIPYASYRELCRNSQIFDADRIRSDSASTPDNLWGWPGYALREMWVNLTRGQWGQAWGIFWQIFTEPMLADTYTPRSGAVYQSIDRESARINWSSMFLQGYGRCLRKTEDGRYLLVYLAHTAESGWHARVMIAPYVHLATGNGKPQLLPQLEHYRQSTGDDQRFIHAYESHNDLYQNLVDYGGRVIIRGRGIVASRILEQIAQLRAENDRIEVLHIMRSPQNAMRQVGLARSLRRHHWTAQPFNWPKSAFGGAWREVLEQTGGAEKDYLYSMLGGVTTAERRDWQQLVETGLQAGWYQIFIGEIGRVDHHADQLHLTVLDREGREYAKFQASYVIDATGFDQNLKSNPLLRDLCEHYDLTLNPYQRLMTQPDFEVTNMRNGEGRLYASGIITFGGAYAPVDSFLGLQYAALRSLDSLSAQPQTDLQRLNGMHSVRQWWHWVRGQNP